MGIRGSPNFPTSRGTRMTPHLHPRRFRLGFLALVACLSACLWPHDARAAKNVILMIADGSGNNTWLATSMYQGKVGRQVYDQPGWRRLDCSTYPLNLSHKPTGNQLQDQSLVYDPVKAWDTNRKNATAKDLALKNATLKEAAAKAGMPAGAMSQDFAAYLYLTTTPTDSAAAATALASGRKTYNNAINWSNDDRPMRAETIAEIAKRKASRSGRLPPSSGAMRPRPASAEPITAIAAITPRLPTKCWRPARSTSSWARAIPISTTTANRSAARNIATISGVGGPETWKALKSGQREWKLIESKAEFEALVWAMPPKVVGTRKRVGQRKRNAATAGQSCRRRGSAPSSPPQTQPFAVPLNRNVPSLAVMTKGAIHCLEDNPQGFYLMIEGGAVDWANHANEQERMVEEQIDFLKAVEAVVAWVDAHSNWNDTLVILTADHETGLLWGPDSAQVAFQPLKDRGAGKLPGMKHNSHGHSNSLVPLYARGPGSERFAALQKGPDPHAAAQWHCSGRYVDNTDVFTVMRAEVVKTGGER